MLSFADELDEEPSPVAFSLAESTMKRCIGAMGIQ